MRWNLLFSSFRVLRSRFLHMVFSLPLKNFKTFLEYQRLKTLIILIDMIWIWWSALLKNSLHIPHARQSPMPHCEKRCSLTHSVLRIRWGKAQTLISKKVFGGNLDTLGVSMLGNAIRSVYESFLEETIQNLCLSVPNCSRNCMKNKGVQW